MKVNRIFETAIYRQKKTGKLWCDPDLPKGSKLAAFVKPARTDNSMAKLFGLGRPLVRLMGTITSTL